MATITSAQTGAWSDTATWTGGNVPVDNDTVVIATGHTVTFGVDTSGFANGIAGLTITGTLTVSTTTSSYLKMKAATTISGAGTFNVGTSGTPIPFAVKFTLMGGSGWYVQGSGGLTMTVYGAEPTYTYAKLSGAESGATRLEIDTDLTGDIWAVGDSVRICNVNKAQNTELRTISAITSTYINISAGLTGAKIAGSYVVLVTRNVAITGVGTNLLKNFTSGKLTIGSGSFTGGVAYPIHTSTGVTISGGVFSGNDRIIDNTNNSTISGGIFTGNTNGVASCDNITADSAVFVGNLYCFNGCSGEIANCTLSGNQYGLKSSKGMYSKNNTYYGNTYAIELFISCNNDTIEANVRGFYLSSAVVSNTTLSSNTYDIDRSIIIAHNTNFASTTENYQYSTLSKASYSESLDHDQTAGAFKAWTKGGITTSVATPVPTGATQSWQIALENVSSEGFFKRHVNVPAGKTIHLALHLRKTASMTYLPRAYVHEKSVEPIIDATGVLHTFEMTDSVDTWESDTFSWENTAAYDVMLDVTVAGKNATGYVYGLVEDTFSGGGISKARLLGGI